MTTMNPAVQTLIVAVVGGVMAQRIAKLIRLPSIIPLLVFGVVLGPEVWGAMPRPSDALPGALPALISVGVAIILFEGGLSLNLKDIKLVPKAVRNLLSIGAAVCFIGSTLAARFIALLDWPTAVLFGTLTIVTGPTVIGPLLKSLKLSQRVQTVLLWEAVLIDPIGAMAAVVALDVILGEAGFFLAGSKFVGPLLIGPIVGLACGWLLSIWLKMRKDTHPDQQEFSHLVALATAFGAYGLSEALVKESGLAAVTCAGMVVANTVAHRLPDLRRFKSTITTLLVSVLFMLLAADFNLSDFKMLWPRGVLAVTVMIVLVRPASVILSTWHTTITWREKLLLSMVAPRGIVAASVAAVFGLILTSKGHAESGQSLVAMTYTTIFLTVLTAGFLTKPLAWLLGLREDPNAQPMIGPMPP